jgi:hypothetical protein
MARAEHWTERTVIRRESGESEMKTSGPRATTGRKAEGEVVIERLD